MNDRFVGGRFEWRQRGELAAARVMDGMSRYPSPATAAVATEKKESEKS